MASLLNAIAPKATAEPSRGRGRDEVYVAAVALRATKGPAQLLMSAAYSVGLWDLQHFLVIIKPNPPPQSHQAVAFDFQPQEPENIYVAIQALSGGRIPGTVLMRKLKKMPKSKCWFVGSLEGDAVDAACKFSSVWDTYLTIGHHDCRDYTNALVEHLSGEKDVLQQLSRHKQRFEHKKTSSEVTNRLHGKVGNNTIVHNRGFVNGRPTTKKMAMMMQTGASASKVLILVGAGLTGTVVLRSGKLFDIILQLQELLKGVNESEISPEKYDGALLASQIQQLAREIRELTLSRPVTIYNGNGHSTSDGSYASYLMPAAALGVMGYCYMWWKGWSISDVMFVTKHNMANAVSTVAKQLENVNEALTSTKRHLSKRLENLDWKMEEQKETSQFIANDVKVVKSDLTQIGCDVEIIHQLVSGLEGKIELLESKQDMTNSGLLHLCQMAGGGVKEGINGKLKGIRNNLAEKPTIAMTHKEASLKGLQFIVEPNGVVEDSTVNAKKFDQDANPAMAVSAVKPRIQSRSHAFGISSVQNITGL